MLKSIAAILAIALTSTGAFAQVQAASDKAAASQASFGVLRYEVRADLDRARASGAWPVRESNDFQAVAATTSRKATHRTRKEYPNVMGVSIDEWLAGREAAAAHTDGE